MKFEKVYQKDGSYFIRQTRDDGIVRQVDEDYHGYVDWVRANKEVIEVPYVAPPPPPKPKPRPRPVLTYEDKRRMEYPDIGDQLDAILKGFNQLRLNGTDLPQDLDDIVGEWLSVKAKYPKPEA